MDRSASAFDKSGGGEGDQEDGADDIAFGGSGKSLDFSSVFCMTDATWCGRRERDAHT
jgi:hypothetical protein